MAVGAGCCSPTSASLAASMTSAISLTTNVAVGTVSYVAPEQLLGKPLDGRADQYALAATTFHLLTGAPPFQDSNRAVVISHHLGTPPPRISERRPDLAHLDAVLARALAKDPNERYPNCLEFARSPHTAGSPPGCRSTAIRNPPRRHGIGRRPPTQRLERLVVHGTARGVRQSASVPSQLGIVSFHVVPYDPIDNRRAPIPVEIQTQLGAGQLADGDEVEVSGVWDGNTLDADEIVSFSADSAPKRRSSPSHARIAARQGTETQKWPDVGTRRTRRGDRVDGGCGCVVHRRIRPLDSPRTNRQAGERDRVFTRRRPGQSAESRRWRSTATQTRRGPPSPTRTPSRSRISSRERDCCCICPDPTALSAVTIDLSSTGTEVQIRSSPTETPAKLADTTELTPTTPLQPGHNRIEVRDSDQDVECAGVDHQIGHDRWPEPDGNLRDHAAGGCVAAATNWSASSPSRNSRADLRRTLRERLGHTRGRHRRRGRAGHGNPPGQAAALSDADARR